MSNISGQLIKDSYNYVLQSDLISGIVYRIGGSVAENPKFISGLTVNANFTYSDGSEFDGFVLTCDASGNATWAPVSAATSGVFVTGGTFDYSAGTLELRNSNGSQVTISGLTDTYVTGGTVSGNTIVFSYNDTNTFEVSGVTSFDTFTSYTASTEQILNSKVDINTFNSEVESLEIEIDNRVQIPTFTTYTATTQPLILNSVTGGTYSGGTLYLINNSGTTIPITGFSASSSSTFTGGTVTGPTNFTNGLTANTISATTYLGNVITSVASVGSGASIYDSTSNTTANIRSITSDTTNKVAVLLNNQTINLGVNEQNLTLWNLVVQGNKLLNGSVSYVSGLTFSVSPLEYLINGQIYTISEETTVTLASGDSTFDRIDVIYADISGNTGVLQGVPSANPEKVLVDGDTEVEVTFVLVRANSTTADVSTLVIYNENSGPPSEWTFGSGGVQPTRIIGNFTGVTYSGGTSIIVSGVTGAYTTFFRLTGLTELNTNNYSTLQFAIRNLSANTTTSLIRFRFLTTGGTQNGSVVTMNGAGTANVVQYSPTNVSTWQLISIPLWRFYLTNTNVQVLEVSFSPQGTGAQSRYYFDLLEFVEGTSSAPPSNSWTTIRGDSASTTITAPNPNATLILSGGTNISSSISGTSTVVFNLDNNINLNGVTATTISATTYQNLPISGLTAGQNINISGTSGNLTISFTGTTGSNFTGGTVTGPTNFTNGLTANTISATTYQNLPVTADTFVTGFSLNSNVITLSQNRTDSYSSFTISLSAYTGSSVSGEYLPLSGGTVTGNTTFTSGLTVNYIDFDTTPNVPAPTGGTVYFDSNENALSYKPITPSNDVTVNLGQESLIRIYNNLGFQINNGQALHVTGATLGVPTVSLAVGTGGDSVQFQISGIATHDIPDSSFGFMTVFGIVRDINLTGFTVGEQIYLSQTVPGGLASYSDLSFTGRTCEVGHILDNSASGKLQVSILNEIEGTIITTQENNILAANNSSTGVFNFSGLSITTPSGTTFNVGPVEGWIIDNVTEPANPTIRLIIYPGSTGNTALYVSSATETYILLTSGLTIIQQTTFPTPQQRRQNLYLGKFGHANKQYLINAFNEPDSSLSPVSQLRDILTPIRLINGGIYPSANGNSLTFNSSAGVLYGLGIGYITNKLDPNSLSVSGTSPCTFQYRTQTGGTASNTTLITPGVYDNNGVVTSVGGGSNSSTNQRIYLVQNGQFRLQYGQQVYGNLAAAIEASQSEAFTTFSNFRDNAILIGILSVNKNATNLSDITQARFLLTSKFGETVGSAGGISTTNLQQAYNNSATPEIVTNSAEGALTIQNGAGTADNVTNLFEGKGSSAGPLSGTTSFIRADGLISGSSVSTPGFTANTGGLTALTISATTYLNLPSATFTGGTVSGPTNFTGGLTANTISATTYQNLPVSGLTEGSNISITGSNGNFTVSFTGTTGSNFTGNTSASCVNEFYVSNIFGCSGITTLQTSIQTVGSTVNGTLSHAEGGGTSVGTTLAYSGTVVNGLITLDSSYGDLTGEFLPTDYLFLTDTEFDNVLFSQSFLIDTVNYTTQTDIQLIDTSLTSTTIYVLSTVDSSVWIGDKTIVSDYSHSEGQASKAIGEGSHAEGKSSNSFGYSSHAEGQQNSSIGQYSHAEGSQTFAIGSESHSEGSLTKSIGIASHAEGVGSQSIGNYSHAEGSNSISNGTFSHSEGRSTQSYGNYSHAEGTSTQSNGESSHAEGLGTISSGDYSHAEGSTTTSTGNYSHAEGENTESRGQYSHAEGLSTQSYGDYSHAEGLSTQSYGDYSHAEGRSTQSYADSSHAEGYGSVSLGAASHAEGYYTESFAVQSHAEGYYTNSGYLGYLASATTQTVTLNSIYGNLTSLFTGVTSIILDDADLSDFNGVVLIGVTGITFDGTNTLLNLKNSISATTACTITLTNNPNPDSADVRKGDESHSEGYYTGTYGRGSHAEGYSGRSWGDYSHVEGLGSQSFGKYSHAEGGGVTYADNSHAEGQGSTFGDYSHAEGGGYSYGQYSHAEGGGNSYGQYSHAEGGGTAYGTWSHAQGSGAVASGISSSAIGYYTITSTDYQVAVGKSNTTGNTTSIFVIGNGASFASRSDLALFNPNGVIFNAGFSATSVSAATYQNVNAVTGGTYSAGQITLSGTGNVNGTQISTKILPVALTVVSNTASTDASLSSLFTLTLTGNTTLATPINGFPGQRILYQLKQDGTGSKLLTLSSGFRSGPITVTLSTAANTTDYLGVIYNAIDDKWDVLALNKGYS
jgi:hypothetical protein